MVREDSMGSNSSIEREDKIVTEVLVVLGELGRGDLVEGLGEVVGGFNNRILNLVVENVNLDSCNTDLMLEIKDLERDIEILEDVIEDRDTDIGDLEDEIVGLNRKLASVRIGV
jgi:hypothetical protein